jgi:methyl-accepting chemotaxis protein
MAHQKDFGSDDELRITRVFPQWFKDLDSALKPVVSSFILLLVAAPCVAFTIIQWNKAAAAHDSIVALMAHGGSKAQLIALTNQFETANHRAQIGIILSAGVAWFGAMFIAYGLTKLSTSWLRHMTIRVQRAAAGDLTTEITRDNASQLGDIQEALGKMIASFHATVVRIDQAAVELRDSAKEMSGISDEAGGAIGEVAHSVSVISIGAGNQVDLIGDTSREVGEIEQSVREAADHAAHASEESAATEELTDEGVRRAAEIEEAMDSVRATATETSRVIRSLGEKSTSIDQIVKSIADIAEQTNLLALNAAIEAARAGEQGRGFAVVAEEVRRLAEDAQESTGEIATLTELIRSQTAEAVAAVDAGSETVEKGAEAVHLNRQAFADISHAVGNLNAGTAKISSIAREIAEEASRVRVEIEDIASVAEESSASTEQVSAATQQSSASAQEVTATAGRVTQTSVALADLAARFNLRDHAKRNVVPIEKPAIHAVDDKHEEQAA